MLLAVSPLAGSPRMGDKEKVRDTWLQRHGLPGGKVTSSVLKHAPFLLCVLLLLWSFSVFNGSGFGHLRLRLPSAPSCEPSAASLLSEGEVEGEGGAGGIERHRVEESESMRRLLQQAREMIGKAHAIPQTNRAEQRSGRQKQAGTGAREVGAVKSGDGDGDEEDLPLSLSIFVAPKPFTGEKSDPQRRALLSWLRLSPPPLIVILGNDPSFAQVAAEFPGRVTVDANIDYNFLGVPQFHSIVARAQAASTELSMIINGDILLLNDLMQAVRRVQRFFKHWVLTAARWDVGQDFPFSFEAEDWSKGGQSDAEREAEIKKWARRTGSLHTYGGVDFWLWNNSPVPLFGGRMPPFTFGRGKYDNWFTHEIIEGGMREMVDASDAIVNIHVAHSYSHVGEGKAGNISEKLNFWSTRKKSNWELFGNIHMAQTHGSYVNQKGTALHVPWRLSSCYEAAVFNMCLQKRTRPANCSCEYSPFVAASQSDPKLEGRHWTCGTVSVDAQQEFIIDPVAKPKATPGLPHTMEQLLPQQARQMGDLKVVILVAVTFGYAEMLMNFVCRLRELQLHQNLLVAALDEDLYRFSFTQGLAVYYEQVSMGLKGIDSKDCAFGTPCFRQFTKLKSRAVLRVLKEGYSVLWTDVDIVWFKDPLPDLASFGPGTFPIQSNEPNATLPGTGIRRINSGFYFARSDAKTIAAFEAITAHAAKTKLSEQPSFYDILCGEKGELLVQGKEECVWTNGLRTIFLDRVVYPNGAVHQFWDQENVTEACAGRGCTILHNNWISGKDAKKERLVKHGFWGYDAERRMCMHSWHSRLPALAFTKNHTV